MPLERRPRLSHSQNFLRDPHLIDHLLDRSTIQPADLVYEVGPGTGIITERLARRCRQVVAIEKDRQLAAYLRGRFNACPNVAIHLADFLRFPLPPAPFKVFANIPYGCTAAIVCRLTAYATAPLDSYLTVQQEAADRFIGTPSGTLTAALLYPWFEASTLYHFQPTDFRPAPRVESVLLRLHRRGHPLVRASDTQFFRDFVTYAFTASRPTIHATLRSCGGRSLADRVVRSERLNPTATPSMLPGTLWVLLFEHLKDAGGEQVRRMVAGAEERLRRQQSGLRKIHRTRVPPLGCQALRSSFRSQAPSANPSR